jgi:hypothetical protein
MPIQSVVFKKPQSVRAAKAWLKKHKLKYGKLDETETQLRFRQFDPVVGAKYFTKSIDDGLMLIISF